jgi:WD40 repeat protein
MRFEHLPADQFLSTLTPHDNYPLLFRRADGFTGAGPLRSTLELLSSMWAHKDSVYNLAFDRLSRFVVSGSDDNTIKLFSLLDFMEVRWAGRP